MDLTPIDPSTLIDVATAATAAIIASGFTATARATYRSLFTGDTQAATAALETWTEYRDKTGYADEAMMECASPAGDRHYKNTLEDATADLADHLARHAAANREIIPRLYEVKNRITQNIETVDRGSAVVGTGDVTINNHF